MEIIGSQLRDLMNSAVTRCRLTVWMDVVAERGRKERSLKESTRFILSVENKRIGAGWYDLLRNRRTLPMCSTLHSMLE